MTANIVKTSSTHIPKLVLKRIRRSEKLLIYIRWKSKCVEGPEPQGDTLPATLVRRQALAIIRKGKLAENLVAHKDIREVWEASQKGKPKRTEVSTPERKSR